MFIMGVFQIAKAELNEIILKRLHAGPCFMYYVLSWHFHIFRYTENILAAFTL